MARLTNAEIWNMSLNEANAYTLAHPAEAWRFAKVQHSSVTMQTKRALKYGLEAGILSVPPKFIETT